MVEGGEFILKVCLVYLMYPSLLEIPFFRSKRFPKILFQAGPIETPQNPGAKAR